jgi:hypothetical protein
VVIGDYSLVIGLFMDIGRRKTASESTPSFVWMLMVFLVSSRKTKPGIKKPFRLSENGIETAHING